MSVAAVVLAAGGSRRMGAPKQLLRFDGQSLLRNAINTALKANCDPVVVVLGAAGDRLRDEASVLSAIIIDNPDWEEGPGTSIRAGMPAVGDAEAVVFLLCDQPFVSAWHIQSLVKTWRESGLPMAASAYADTLGVPAIFDETRFRELRRLPSESGAKKLLLAQPDLVAAVPFPDGAVDLDTPADAARARMEWIAGDRR